MRLDVQFNPFTYEELIRPIADYNEAYNALADSYATLSDQTEAFRNEVNATDSPIAYEQFNKYSDNLGAAIDDFSRGMTSSNRANLLNMKRRYSKEIGTIAKAAEARKAANDLRDKAGPDAIFEVSSYNSLDDFLGGKVANNKYQSATAITSETAALIETVMKNAIEDPEIRQFLDAKSKETGYNLLIQHTGGSYEDLQAALSTAILEEPSIANKFQQIKNQVLKSHGYERHDALGKAAMERAVNTGLFVGLDKPVKTLIENRNFITPQIRENQRQFNLELTLKGYNKDGTIDKNNPYWKAIGLEWDDKNNEWKVGKKPGTGDDTLIPEYVDGKPTGRYYRTGDRKYYNADGTLTYQGSPREKDVLANVDFTPGYWRAWSKGASKNFEPYAGIDYNHTGGDIIDYTDLTGDDAKDYVKNYIKGLTGYDGDITDEMITDIIPFIEIERDGDWASKNHFKVNIIGVNPDGSIDAVNRKAVLSRYNKILEKLSESASIVDTPPAPQETPKKGE